MPDLTLLHVELDADLLGELHEFAAREHFGSRAAAVRWLLRMALKRRLTPFTVAQEAK